MESCKATCWPEGRVGQAAVGESWEVSVDSVFPSAVESGTPLAEVIASAPEQWLGPATAARWGQTPLLVKILDASDWLSIQVHPGEGDPTLGPLESPKPEAWIILETRGHAELLLGFREGVDGARVREQILSGAPLDVLMNRVSVSPGDVFVIEAGTPHAIGPGVTLLEPQWNEPGRHGVTCRFWDWDRRYDADGLPSEAGEPRELHLDRSLGVTRWRGEGGEAWVDACRRQPRTLQGSTPTLQGLELVREPWLYAESWSGSGCASLLRPSELVALTCVRGSVEFLVEDAPPLRFGSGESVVVPAAIGQGQLCLEDAEVYVTTAPWRSA